MNFDDILKEVKTNLTTKEELSAFESELRDKKREHKLYTEVFILWKYIKAGFKISRPPRKDCIIETNSKKYDIEIYQPDSSKVKRLKNSQKNAKEKIFGKHKVKYYTGSFIIDDFLKEFVSNVINNKKRKNQLISNADTKNVLLIDLSDISLPESLIIEDSDTFDWFNMINVKQKLHKWNILDALIISIWKNGEKSGILLNKNLDKIDIDILRKGINLKNIL